ncbi:Oidioi.mRNA.OKI2018_I69.chr1.g859.t1.cds [Oikopleura dioica]|uniref:Oidioi.mRNA.OKI2018_I69.chr1.g844.t1.cds n=1 Tax=Oikopleura dioica TaxID=34765 RepID=A0ABN7SL79_OIKDI|nr:Oidioi.mRNA.OKI2018_I69.chr1.g844.t1.cds [Oikopleura dioica]CAG5103628.1 Oidioi.mRNA.OKI2018_I69.chr1.g859.t1.cds [Oikopleura dioica]
METREVNREVVGRKEEEGKCSVKKGKWRRPCFVFLTFIIYVIIGTFSFGKLEGPAEIIRCKESQRALVEMRDSFEINSDGQFVLSEKNLTDIIATAEEYAGKGVPISMFKEDPEEPCPMNWTPKSAVYFVMTVVTTIGYGNTAPKTVGGRIFFIFYVIPGIVLCGALLGEIAKLYTFIRKKIRRRFEKIPLFLKFLFVLLFGIGFFICIPAMIVCLVEGWTYFEALYFMVVTFTTVGFGDYSVTPGSNYQFGIVIFIYLGLAWLGSIIGAIQEKLENRLESSENNNED